MRANLFETSKLMPSSVSFYNSEFLKGCHPSKAYWFLTYLPFPFLQFLSQSSPPEDNCSPHLSRVLWARLERVAPEVEGRKWQSVEKREKLVSFKPEGNCCRPMSSLEDRIRYITVMSSKRLPVIHGSNVLPKKLRIEYGWEKFICTFQRTEVLDFLKLSPPALYGLIAPKLNSACWHRKFPSRSKNNSGFGEGERESWVSFRSRCRSRGNTKQDWKAVTDSSPLQSWGKESIRTWLEILPPNVIRPSGNTDHKKTGSDTLPTTCNIRLSVQYFLCDIQTIGRWGQYRSWAGK